MKHLIKMAIASELRNFYPEGNPEKSPEKSLLLKLEPWKMLNEDGAFLGLE